MPDALNLKAASYFHNCWVRFFKLLVESQQVQAMYMRHFFITFASVLFILFIYLFIYRVGLSLNTEHFRPR